MYLRPVLGKTARVDVVTKKTTKLLFRIVCLFASTVPDIARKHSIIVLFRYRFRLK